MLVMFSMLSPGRVRRCQMKLLSFADNQGAVMMHLSGILLEDVKTGNGAISC